jgi:hypothetical protein
MAVRAMETPMALEEFIMIYNLNSMVRKKTIMVINHNLFESMVNHNSKIYITNEDEES